MIISSYLFVLIFDLTLDCCPEDDFEDVDEEEDAEEEDDDNEEEEEEDVEEDETNFTEKEKMLKAIRREGEENLFPPLDGTAFYLLTCKINHSCDPNVIVTYINTDKGLQARLLVLKDIATGEEFVQSYIDQSQPLGARQASLVDYGFACSCSKCSEEMANKTVA